MIPGITVIIPVYNRKRELERALRALAGQTLSAFEVVVCDDGSTEDLRDTVAAFEGALSLRYVRIDNSGGPARPRNVAIGLARGEWIAFLDSDDWWDADRLEQVSRELGDDVDFVYHRLRVVTEPGLSRTAERRKTIGEPLRGDPLGHMLVRGNPIPNSAAVVRRSLLQRIGGICEDRAIVAEDFDAWLRLAETGARIRFLDKVLGAYWVGEDGISAFSRRQIDGQATLFARHVGFLGPDARPAAEACHHYAIGSQLLQLGGARDEAYAHLLRAARLPSLALRMKRNIKLARLVLARAWPPKRLSRKTGN